MSSVRLVVMLFFSCIWISCSLLNFSDSSTSGTSNRVSETSNDYRLKISPFTAKYYSGTSLVRTETVLYSGSANNDASQFSQVTWEGEIELLVDGPIDVGLSSWEGSASVKIDGVSVAHVSGFHSTDVVNLTAGKHQVLVSAELFTNFNASFKWHQDIYPLDQGFGGGLPLPVVPISDLGLLVRPLVDGNTRIVHVQISESQHFNNVVEVEIPSGSQPVLLILTTYFAVNWRVTSNGVPIKGVVYSAYDSGQTLSGVGETPQFEVYSTSLYSIDDPDRAAAITALAGRPADTSVRLLNTDVVQVMIP